MSSRTIEQTKQDKASTLRGCEIAEMLVTRLLASESEQLQLFQSEREQEEVERHDDGLEMMRAANPGRLVLDAGLVQRYRYEAAMYGAGFHPSQFDEVTWRDNELAGETTLYLGVLSGMWGVHHHPDKIGRANKMHDEVEEELFATHVPTTSFEYAYEHPVYVTSKDDLLAIYVFDQSNLAACKWLDIDLLYEEGVN